MIQRNMKKIIIMWNNIEKLIFAFANDSIYTSAKSIDRKRLNI